MSMRNVDLQVLIPRLQEVGRVQQVQQQQGQEQQQQFAAQFRQAAELLQNKIKESPRSEKGEVRERETSRRGARHEGQPQQEPQQEAEDTRPAKDPQLGGLIDIKV
ncbi:MAG: hypothetical protein QHH02_08205 [Syntrophomonadaceae bacterium]|nr:hypothetical protein [Syntrophomonadaceae bacterium]